MFFQCFQRIIGATWIEAAMISEKRTEYCLINPNQKDQEMLHFLANLCQCADKDAR